ncbi:hypothetical protein SLEP1_g56599 [Rubroshorea leprosula]|uniref:CCHC-type domain-containing protein n=1 Tax=Rubroshorea leprosula TaxID=152421 RepID=A0AAV5MIZ6_9ROSI|nr:hypothetical protein SLEP1_g56599 [Rubroshorea leprosula]
MAMKDYDNEEENKKKKTIALKATQHNESEEEGDSDEDIAILTKKFKKFLKKKNFKKQGGLKRNNKNDRYKGDSNKKDGIICYHCKKPGHVKFKCPFGNEKSLKVKEKKSKKALVTTWSDDSSDKESSDFKVANLCLMAREEDTQEVSSKSIPNDEFNSLEELPVAFDEFYEESRKMSAKNASLKNTIASLLNEKEGLQNALTKATLKKEEVQKSFDDLFFENALLKKNDLHKIVESLKNDNTNLKKVLDTQSESLENERNTLISKCNELEKKNGDLSNTVSKLIEGSSKLQTILVAQRNTSIKTGIGYKGSSGSTTYTTKFVKASHDPSTGFQNQGGKSSTQKRYIITCHCCCRKGHHVSRYFIKWGASNGSKWIWVPKGSISTLTNTHGPKKIWVPKPTF